ncbi:MAG: hypothetical protein AVDCRST_MAG11-2279, partial [uncultured Gemmatimonadaceae bacterium]
MTTLAATALAPTTPADVRDAVRDALARRAPVRIVGR